MKANHKEALKLALDALDEFCELGAIIRPLEVRDALQKALAEQPAQYSDIVSDGGLDPRNNPPAQRTWVGFTESEIKTSPPYSIARDKGCFHAGVLWAEAKLKEKNNG